MGHESSGLQVGNSIDYPSVLGTAIGTSNRTTSHTASTFPLKCCLPKCIRTGRRVCVCICASIESAFARLARAIFMLRNLTVETMHHQDGIAMRMRHRRQQWAARWCILTTRGPGPYQCASSRSRTEHYAFRMTAAEPARFLNVTPRLSCFFFWAAFFRGLLRFVCRSILQLARNQGRPRADVVVGDAGLDLNVRHFAKRVASGTSWSSIGAGGARRRFLISWPFGHNSQVTCIIHTAKLSPRLFCRAEARWSIWHAIGTISRPDWRPIVHGQSGVRPARQRRAAAAAAVATGARCGATRRGRSRRGIYDHPGCRTFSGRAARRRTEREVARGPHA